MIHDGKYEVRSSGIVFSHARNKRIELKGAISASGYKVILLTVNNEKIYERLHLIVAKAFIPNPNNYSLVKHIDGNKLNNRVDNLKWTNSYVDNCNHLLGKKIGRLTLLELKPYINKANIRGILQCDCGVVIERSMAFLKNTDAEHSCGCARIDKLKQMIDKVWTNPDREHSMLKSQYGILKSRNKKWTSDVISLETFKELVKSDCFYCGSKPHKKTKDRIRDSLRIKLNGNKFISSNGIDRIDNTKGYIDGNCVPCCKTCNSAKGQLTLDQFLEWAQRLNDIFVRKGLKNGK